MADIFLSYSNKDFAVASGIYAALKAAGYSVSWDRDIPSGADWSAWLSKALHGAPVCVVLWSKESVKSRSVAHEAAIALEGNKLVPAMIGRLTAGDFPLGCYTIQAANLTGFRGIAHSGMQDLLDTIAHRLHHKIVASESSSPEKLTLAHPALPAKHRWTHAPVMRALAQVELAVFTFFGCVAGYVLITGSGPGATMLSNQTNAAMSVHGTQVVQILRGDRLGR